MLYNRGTLAEQIFRGFMPAASLMPPDLAPEFFKMYERTYIERDARVFTNVNDAELFSRFFRLVAALSARELNYRQLGRDIGLSPATAQRWLDVLKGTFQWHEISAFAANPVKRVSLKPKGYITDPAIMCHALSISSPAAILSHPLWGFIFETLTASEIVKNCGLMSPSPALYHWRSHGGAEVDFVVEKDGVLYPIEVKAGSHPARADTSGITALRKAHPGTRVGPGLVVAPCETSYALSPDDWAMPWDAHTG
jgi:predicted AAA+ superfamily ATPase